MTATKKHTAPPWWGLFLTHVRQTGAVADSLEATRWKGKKLSRTAHIHHIGKSEELRLELDAAIKEGTAAIKLARVNAVLDQLRTGTALKDALRATGEAQSSFYVFLAETGNQELYDEITHYWYRKRKGFEEAIEYTDGHLAEKQGQLTGAAAVHIERLRKVLAACNKPSVELAKAPNVALRDEIIRIIGSEFKDEEDCPPFLKEDEDVAQSLTREGAGDHQGVQDEDERPETGA